MLDTANTIVDLVSNLLDPGGFVAAVLGNAYAYRARRAPRSPSTRMPKDAVLVRIEIVAQGALPRYRIENGGQPPSQGGAEYWVFDGKDHQRVRAAHGDGADAHWSNRATTLGDVENLALVIRRFDNFAGSIPAASHSTN